MKGLLIAGILLAGLSVQAETFYFVNGKKVANSLEASMALKANPKATVLKVQANFVELNSKTGRLKKVQDAKLQDIPKQ